MFAGLDDIPWHKLRHAYGPATNIPGQLRDFIDGDADERDAVLWEEWHSNVYHQGSRYSASPVIMPFLAEMAGQPDLPERVHLLDLLVHLRLGFPEEYTLGGLEPPGELDGFDAGDRGVLAAALAAQRHDDQDMLTTALVAAYESCVPVFRRLLIDSDSAVRAAAAFALAWHGQDRSRSVDAVVERLAVESIPAVRFSLLLALAQLDDGATPRRVLVEALGPGHPLTDRLGAAIAYVRIAPDRCLQDVIEVLRAAAANPAVLEPLAEVLWHKGGIGNLVYEAFAVLGIAPPEPAVQALAANDFVATDHQSLVENAPGLGTQVQQPADGSKPAGPVRAGFTTRVVDSWRPDGEVALTADAERIYLARRYTSEISRFTGLSRRMPDLLAMGLDGTEIAGLPEFAYQPRSVIADDRSGFYVGAALASSAGSATPDLVRITADGTIDPHFWPEVVCARHDDGDPKPITAMALHDGLLYIRGDFAKVDSDQTSLRGIVALDALTGSATDLRIEVDPSSQALAAAPSRLFMGASEPGLDAFDPVSGARLDWAPLAMGRVAQALVEGDTVYATTSPSFESPLPAVHAIDAATGEIRWTRDVPGPNLLTLLGSNDRLLYVGVSHGPGKPKDSVLVLNRTTGADVEWLPVNGDVLTGAIHGRGHDAMLTLMGHFTKIGDVERKGVAQLRLADHSVTEFKAFAHPCGYMSSCAANGDRILAVGNTKRHEVIPTEGVAAIDVATGEPTDWQLPVDGEVHLIQHMPDGTLWLTGSFTSVAGVPRQGAAAVDTATGTVGPWAPRFDGAVTGLRLDPFRRRLYAYGHFTQVNGEERLYVAAFDTSTGELLPWKVRPDNPVKALAVDSNRVWLGGSFKRVNRARRQALVAVDADTAAIDDVAPAVDGSVTALCVIGDWLAVAGGFDHLADIECPHLGALDRATGTVVDWKPDPSTESYTSPQVTALTAWGDTLWVSGDFRTMGGVECSGSGKAFSGIAAFTVPSGELVDWCPPPEIRPAKRILTTGEQVLVFGTFRDPGSPGTRRAYTVLQDTGDRLTHR